MISHDNITWTTINITEHYMDLSHKDKVVSYLPLSHIAAQLIDIYGAKASLILCNVITNMTAKLTSLCSHAGPWCVHVLLPDRRTQRHADYHHEGCETYLFFCRAQSVGEDYGEDGAGTATVALLVA